ncbi:MAG: DEAD/DEAH box helicase [Nanoarchaeota archaeon]
METIKLSPREYQKSILDTAKDNNTLVVLPTGIGKTLIALMLSVERIQKFPGKKVLILAPTRPLVEQHLESFKKNLPELFAGIDIFTGTVNSKKRMNIWKSAEIIFSTPQCIANDVKKGLYNLEDVSLLVIDEAHRCLKNYDYTYVANAYKSQAINQRILGLTASPGSEKDRVTQICKNLGIEKLELRTRDSEDVKPYLQQLEIKKHEVQFPQDFIELRVLLKRIYDSKVEQLKNRNLLFEPANKITLLKLQNRLASQVNPGNFNAMIGMSLCAQAIKISHAMELLETQTISGLNEYLKNLERQAREKKSKGVQTLVNSAEFKATIISINRLIENKIEHPKIGELKKLIEGEFKNNKQTKIIIFTQYRETANTISNKLNEIPDVKSKTFVGQAKKQHSSGSSGLSQKEQKEVIEQFKLGNINVLCATSIGEEGLDIPEVNAVYFYEPIPSEIRKIQRAGRTARLSKGKLVILITKGTRDEAYHYASIAREKKMKKIIESVKKELDNKPITLDDFSLNSN